MTAHDPSMGRLAARLNEPAQQPASIGRRNRSPGWERSLRPGDRGIGLFDPSLLELGDRLLSGGIDDCQHSSI